MATPADRVSAIKIEWESGRVESVPITFAEIRLLIDRLNTVSLWSARKVGECVDCGSPLIRENPHRNGKIRCPACWDAHELQRHRDLTDYRRRQRAAANAVHQPEEYRCQDCGDILTRESRLGKPPSRCPWCRKEHERKIDREWKAAKRTVLLDFGYEQKRARPTSNAGHTALLGD